MSNLIKPFRLPELPGGGYQCVHGVRQDHAGAAVHRRQACHGQKVGQHHRGAALETCPSQRGGEVVAGVVVVVVAVPVIVVKKIYQTVKTVAFLKVYKFVRKYASLSPNLHTLRNPASLGPNLQGFETLQV